MAEAKHTPGPWSVKSDATTHAVVGADGVRVVSTSWHGRTRNPYPLKDEALANALLCAAAPELLEALKEAREMVVYLKDSRWSEAEGSYDDWVHPIDKVIAKAEGRP